MTDSSPLVPWVTALLSCVASYVVARLAPRPLSLGMVLLSGAKCVALSIASFFLGSLLHGICIDTLHRCVTHGDINIQYAMGGVLAFPVLWLIVLVFGRRSDDE